MALDIKALVASLHGIADSTLATIELLNQVDRDATFPSPTPGANEQPIGYEAAGPNPDYHPGHDAGLLNPQRIIPWGGTVTPEFLMSCIWIEEQIGLKPESLLPCMKFESNLNPAAKNPASSASGLIQFMDSTAKRLGTTTAALRAMTAVTQLSYVYRYFKEYHDRGFDLSRWSLEDTYMAILWPAAIGKPEDYRVFVNDPNKLKDAYDVNRGLDLNKDGFITKKEACARVVKLAAEGTAPDKAGFI